MKKFTPIITAVLCYVLPVTSFAAESQVGYSVTYSGGSLPTVKGGDDLSLRLDNGRVRLFRKRDEVVAIPANAITEVSYGQEVHRRIGTAAGLAVVSLGIGAIVAFSKSKKHYIGITWADGDAKGGISFQADKNEYRGLLTALEGMSGRKAVDADAPAPAPVSPPAPVSTPAPLSASVSTPAPVSAPVAQLSPKVPERVTKPEVPQGIAVRFVSAPTNAEVDIDGTYWGTTPTADLTRLPAGTHTIVVKKIGYQRWERKLDLAPGDDRTVNAELEIDTTKPRISGL